MPELIKNGPNIPVEALNKLENEKVVFFAGAGISAGKPSNLPTFKELIKKVYKEINIGPDRLEKIALNWKKRNKDKWNPSFIDRTFQLLEREHRLGGDKLRKVIAELLSKKPEETEEYLTTHKALLDLSDTASGIRLVTTNFDNRFCEAACQYGVKLPPIDIAPRLPVASPDRWSSIVHLHGSISSSNLKDLVLTSADFGRAYLTHGWATKFLIDLFQEYTVIFAGYSIEDPVMRYLIDAIATQPRKKFNQPFVFAPFNREYGSEIDVKDRWKSMGVEPILFNKSNDYRYLNDTLIAWAEIYRKPLAARKNIVLDEISKTPMSRSDPIVERLLWALQESTDIAQYLADDKQIENNDQEGFTRVASWLDIFFEEGFIGGKCKEENNSSESSKKGYDFTQPTECWKPISKYNFSEEVEWQLIRWALKRLHIPQVFTSVYFYYPLLPKKYIENFKLSLIKYRNNIPNQLWCLWFVLLHDDYPKCPTINPILNYYYSTNLSDIERCFIEDRLIKCMSPKFIIKHHPTQKFLDSYFSGVKNDPTQPSEIETQAILVFGEEDACFDVENTFAKEEFRIRNAEMLTDYLERAIRLVRETADRISDDNSGKNRFDLYINRPVIRDHKQNKLQTKNMKFVDFVRDSYFDLVKIDKDRAEHLLQRWVKSGEPLFKRLALNAITEITRDDIRHVRKLLLDSKNPGLLDQDLEREVLRFLCKVWLRLPEEIRTEILQIISDNVPKTPMNINQINKEELRFNSALYLFKLVKSGDKLNEDLQELVNKFNLDNEEDLDYLYEYPFSLEFGWIEEMDLTPKALLDGSVENLITAIEKWDFKTDKPALENDVFRALFIKDPQKVLDAMCRLAKNSKCIPSAWAICLQELNSEIIRKAEMIDRINEAFESFTDNQIKMLNSSAPSYIQLLATECEIDHESKFSKLWLKVWKNIDSKTNFNWSENNILNEASTKPAGRMAEAALARLRKYLKSGNKELPASVKRYFDKIASADDGHWGRVILAHELFLLYGINPKWTEENLIPQMSQAEKTESQHLWLAFSSSQKIGPDLLAAIEDSFVNILLISKAISNKNLRCQLTKLFMNVCFLSPPISLKRKNQIVKSMPEDMLKTVLSYFKCYIFPMNDDDSASCWQNIIQPWLDQYWPRLGENKTMKMSELMLEVLANCGKAYNEAAEWFLEFLVPVEGYTLSNLKDIELSDKSAETTLKILRKVVDKKVICQNNKSNLKCILENLNSVCYKTM